MLMPAVAWQTIRKINRESFSPGDSILFKCSETWRFQFIVSSSGASGDPIVFGAYGSGDKPVLSGSEIVSNWTQNFSYVLSFDKT